MRKLFGLDLVVLSAALLLFPVAANRQVSPFLGAPGLAKAVLTPEPEVELVIEFPPEGAAIGAHAPPVAVRIAAPDGRRVAPERLAFTREGERLAMDCVAVPGGAECEPLFDFDDGEVSFAVSAVDRRGHRSPPVERRFRVDRVPPRISLTSPAADFLATGSTVQVAGFLSEDAALTIGGEAVPLRPDRSFAVEVNLAEGANVILVGARDAAGNDAVEVRSGFCDSIPPQPVAAELVRADLAGKKVDLQADAGAAEPGMRIRWRNPRTGQVAETDAQADGAFAARLLASPGDELVAVAIDAFDRESEPAIFPVGHPPAPAEAVAWLPAPRDETGWLPPLFALPKNETSQPEENIYPAALNFLAFLPAVALPESSPALPETFTSAASLSPGGLLAELHPENSGFNAGWADIRCETAAPESDRELRR